MSVDSGALSFDAYINNSDFKRSIDEMESRLRGMSQTGEREFGKVDNTAKKVLGGIGAYLSIQAFASFGQELIKVRGEFQKYEAVLTNSLESSNKAKESLAMLTRVAATTPFQLDAITGSYIKLVNQGFTPTEAEIIKLGDLSAAVGKDFNQLAEAILDAQTGEWERLKEFGIKAKVAGDQVTFSFKGVKTTVDNTAESVKAYMLSLGDMKGIKGSMEAISKTLVGQVSNLQDSITSMFNQIGQSSEGILSGAVAGAGILVANYAEIAKVLGVLIATYGTYKAVMITVTAAQGAYNAMQAVRGTMAAVAAVNALSVALGGQAVATGVLATAQAALNLVSPLGWVALAAAAVVGVVVAYKAFTKELTVAEKLSIAHTEAMAKSTAQIKNYQAEVNKLLSTAKNLSLSEEERNLALTKLKMIMPGVIDSVTLETLRTKEATTAIEAYNEAKKKGFTLASAQAQLSDIETRKEAINEQRFGKNAEGKTLYGRARADGALGETKDLDNKLATDYNALLQQQLRLQTEINGANDVSAADTNKKAAAAKQEILNTETTKERIKRLQEEIALQEKKLKTVGLTAAAFIAANKIIKADNAQLEELGVDTKGPTKTDKAEALKRDQAGFLEFTKELGEQIKINDAIQSADMDKEIADLVEIARLETERIELADKYILGLALSTQSLEQTLYGIDEKAKTAKEAIKGSFLIPENEKAARMAEIDRMAKADKDASKDTAFQKTELFKQITDSALAQGKKELQARIGFLNLALKSEEISIEERKKLNAELLEAQSKLNGPIKTEAVFKEIAITLGNIANMSGIAGSNIAAMAAGAAQVAGQMANVYSKLDDAGKMSQQDAVGLITDGATQLIGIIVNSSAERKAKLDAYYKSAIAQQREYNFLLNEQLLINNEIRGSVFLSDYEGRLKDGTKAYNDAQKNLQRGLGDLADGEAITGMKKVIDGKKVLEGAGAGAAIGAAIGTMIMPVIGTAIGGAIGAAAGAWVGIFGGKKEKDVLTPVLREYPNLIKVAADGTRSLNIELAKTLSVSGQVTEATKDTLKNIIDWQTAADEATKQMKSVISDLTSGMGDELRNVLVKAFTDGTDAAQAFGDTVEGVLENIMSNMIFNAAFGVLLKKLETEMLSSFDVGADQSWVDDFARFFKGVPEATSQFNKGMVDAQKEAKANGFDIFGKTTPNGSNGMTGSVKAVTEQTAGAVVGQMNAMRINQGLGIEVMRDSLFSLNKIELNTRYNKLIFDKLNANGSVINDMSGTGIKL